MNNNKMTQVVFTGKASEYFGIWIVNLLLTILTFGIYSAWAKVRRKKYFYNNTLIDNVGFDYHAKPIAILKGRLIAFVFFVGYAFGGEVNVFVPIIFVVLFFLALPWIVVRASLFNARNTSHRGLRFDFVGKLGEAVLIFILLPIVTLFSLYLALPYMEHQRNKFMMSNHRFGLSRFDLHAKVSSFYKVYAILLIIPLIIGILLAIAIPAYQSYSHSAVKQSEMSMPYVNKYVDVEAGNQIVLVANAVDQQNVAEESQDEVFKEILDEHKQEQGDTISTLLKNASKTLFVMVAVFAYLIIIFGFVAYFKARIGNLIWNNTTLEDLSFKSSLRVRDFWWIYMTNMIAIILTFGLATPWAQVRTARYRASKLQIVGDVDFDQFVGDKKDAVRATGEEIADFFDADFSFG